MAVPSPLVRLAWLALRFGRTQVLAQQLPQWAALFTEVLENSGGSEELSRVVHYLLIIEKGRQEGMARGRAEGVLRILAARGVQVSDTARHGILSCRDMSLLDQWFDRALNATSLSEVLEPSEPRE